MHYMHTGTAHTRVAKQATHGTAVLVSFHVSCLVVVTITE